jgi:hypothetical protein
VTCGGGDALTPRFPLTGFTRPSSWHPASLVVFADAGRDGEGKERGDVGSCWAVLGERSSGRAFRFATKLPRSSYFGGLHRLGWARRGQRTRDLVLSGRRTTCIGGRHRIDGGMPEAWTRSSRVVVCCLPVTHTQSRSCRALRQNQVEKGCFTPFGLRL